MPPSTSRCVHSASFARLTEAEEPLRLTLRLALRLALRLELRRPRLELSDEERDGGSEGGHERSCEAIVSSRLRLTRGEPSIKGAGSPRRGVLQMWGGMRLVEGVEAKRGGVGGGVCGSAGAFGTGPTGVGGIG